MAAVPRMPGRDVRGPRRVRREDGRLVGRLLDETRVVRVDAQLAGEGCQKIGLGH